MKECNFSGIRVILAATCVLLLALSSCARIPVKDGGLVIGKDTTASIEDIGVASVNSRF